MGSVFRYAGGCRLAAAGFFFGLFGEAVREILKRYRRDRV